MADVNELLALQREYPVRLVFDDGHVETDTLYAIREETALRFFDDMFMSLHNSRRLLDVDGDDPITRKVDRVVRMELIDYMSGVMLAGYDLQFESEV